MPRELTERPIPRSHTFPCGYRVRIVEDEIKPKGKIEEGCVAEWDIDAKTIRLWVGLTPGQKWRRLYHELLHAAIDAQRSVELRTGVN